MLAKFQLSHAPSLHVFNSPKAASPCVGVSVTPPFKKLGDYAKKKQQMQVLERPSGGKSYKKNGSVGNPFGEIEKSEGMAEEGLSREGFLVEYDCKIRDGGKFGVNSIIGGGSTREKEAYVCNTTVDCGRRGVMKKGNVKGNGLSGIGGERDENSLKGEKAVKEMLRSKCSTKCRTYGGYIPAMLEALEAVNDLDEALSPWELSLTNKERSILLKEQVRWERAMEIFEWFKRKGCYEINIIHYNIMLRILGRACKWSEVERLWSEMEENGIKPINSTFGTLIDVYSKGGLREEAIKWLELMSDYRIEPDEVTMGTVVQMYKKAGDFKSAEEFFKKWSSNKRAMEKRRSVELKNKLGINGDQMANTCLSTHTYNTLIDTFGKAGKLLEANETFEQMLKENIVPTTITFNTMIHMYGNDGQLGEVSLLMRKMEEDDCSPDTRTYNILISVNAKHNNIEIASGYLKKMKESSLEPDAVSYRTLLYAFSLRCMVGEAEELVSEMDERGLEIDEFTQSALTRMYIEAGMVECSWSWFLRFHVRGNMTSECYSANIDAFGERGYITEAEKVFNCCLETKRLSVLEFNVMIKAFGICKKFEQACYLFDSMDKYGVIPDKCSYNSLIQMLASADLAQKATHYLRKMQEAGLVIDCIPYCMVISSYAKLFQLDKAVGLYDEMIDCRVRPDVVIYGVLINAFAEAGNVQEATKYINAMKDVNLPMNNVLCKSLIKLYTKVGYLKEAEETYRTLLSMEASHDLYSSNCMIDLYSERSMISEAEKIFKNLAQNGVANEFTYAMLLRMYKRNGMFVEALCIAQKMRELGLMTDLLSYNNVLGLYASDGRFKDAVSTFYEMLKSDIQPDDSTFKSLRIILLKCGVPTGAINKYELTRKNDAQSGLQAWISILCSVMGSERGH